MGESGPGGLPKKLGTEDVVKRPEETVATPGQFVEMEAMADAFASICAENLDQDLTSEVILGKMIEKGFPKGLASYLGASLLERIKDARQTLAVAATKPKLKDALVATVREEIIEYFKTRESEIIKFFEVTQDPMMYLDIMANVLPDADFSNITIDQLNRLTRTIGRFHIDEIKLLTIVGRLIKTTLEEELKVPVRRVNEPRRYAARTGIRLIISLDVSTDDNDKANSKMVEIQNYLQAKFAGVIISRSIVGNINPVTELEIWVK